jgi:hypothetical protein
MTLFVEMLQAAGTRALFMGLTGILCTVWGAFQFYYPPQTRNRILHLICSTTPARLGLWVFYTMFSSYTHIAHSTVAPTRAEFDLVMSDAVVFGGLSLLCTLIPLSLAIAGMMKNRYSTRLAG